MEYDIRPSEWMPGDAERGTAVRVTNVETGLTARSGGYHSPDLNMRAAMRDVEAQILKLRGHVYAGDLDE